MKSPPFCHELYRLASFKEATLEGLAVSAVVLARNGFRFLGPTDETECVFCKAVYKGWKVTDKVEDIHYQLNPACLLLTDRLHCGDIPLGSGVENKSDEDLKSTQRLVIPEGNQISQHDMVQYDSARYDDSLVQQPQSYSIQKEANFSALLDSLKQSLAASADNCASGQYSRMRVEATRVLSFAGSSLNMDREVLAAAGLYWTGEEDICKCPFCRGTITVREARDDPIEVHRQKYPNCCLVTDPMSSGNVPTVINASGSRPGDDIPLPAPVPAPPTPPELRYDPHHPLYMDQQIRADTFRNWPVDRYQTARQLSEAGFWFTGTKVTAPCIDDSLLCAGSRDNVRCFHCDGGLCNWVPEDDPWIEHARWFPYCVFLRQAKSVEWVEEIQQRYALTDATPNHTGESALALSSTDYSDSDSDTAAIETNVESVDELLQGDVAQQAIMAGYSSQRVKLALRKIVERGGHRGIDINDILNEIDSLPNTAPVMPERAELRPDSENPAATANDDVTKDKEAVADTPNDTQSKKRRRKKKKAKAKERQADNDKEGDEVNSLVNEYTEMVKNRMCKICLGDDSTICFLPCGHISACSGCAKACKRCPVCRTVVRALVRVYTA